MPLPLPLSIVCFLPTSLKHIWRKMSLIQSASKHSFHLFSEDLLKLFGASMEERSAAMTATAISFGRRWEARLQAGENNCNQVFATIGKCSKQVDEVALEICPRWGLRSVRWGREQRTERARHPSNIARVTCAHNVLPHSTDALFQLQAEIGTQLLIWLQCSVCAVS